MTPRQLDMFSASITARFREFDRDHPDVWRLFERFTFEAIARGHKHHSADAVLHRVRWETDAGDRLGEFKINNNFAALYSRKWSATHPQHAGFFRTRERKAA